jgi:hypothetical protein
MSLSTLNGTFATFPLPEVLRLVAVSDETGRLKVESPTLSGRVYVVEGSIVYATTRTGDDLIDDLARLERITDEERDAIERRAVSLEDVRGTRKEVLDVFFKHQVSEVLVRLLGLPDGEFSFAHGVMMTHPVGFRFETEDALAAAEARSEQWREIRQVIPSVETPFRMADEIDGTVTIDPDRWALLAMLPEARSARGLAVKLKIFEFEAARRLADLARAGLIVDDPDTRVESTWHKQAEDQVSEERMPENDVSENEMTQDEAAELLGSFMAIASRDDQGVDGAETGDVNEEEAEVDGDDGEDLTNRWKKLRTTRVADKKR